MDREEAQAAMACEGCVFWRQELGHQHGLKENEGYCYYERRVHVKRTDQFCSDHAQLSLGIDESMLPQIYEGTHEDEN